VKLLHLGIHDTFRNVLLTEGLGELLPRDTPRVLVGVAVATLIDSRRIVLLVASSKSGTSYITP
jgi:hypothetical protein